MNFLLHQETNQCLGRTAGAADAELSAISLIPRLDGQLATGKLRQVAATRQRPWTLPLLRHVRIASWLPWRRNSETVTDFVSQVENIYR